MTMFVLDHEAFMHTFFPDYKESEPENPIESASDKEAGKKKKKGKKEEAKVASPEPAKIDKLAIVGKYLENLSLKVFEEKQEK